MTTFTIPTLETERLILRAPHPDDLLPPESMLLDQDFSLFIISCFLLRLQDFREERGAEDSFVVVGRGTFCTSCCCLLFSL